MQFTWIVALLFAILVAVFALQNTTPVDVSLLLWTLQQAPLALVIVMAAAGGALITLLLGLPRVVRGALRLRSLRKQLRLGEQRVQELEAELERLRGRPRVETASSGALAPSSVEPPSPRDVTPRALPGESPASR